MIGGTNTGGGGLNLRIVDGNTRPVSPVENMVWINTETRIPDWYWQAEEPSNKETGTLWIATSNVSSNNLNLLRHNTLVVGVGTIRQWDGTQWQLVGGSIYYGGAWHNLQTFVYDGSIGNAENNFNHNVGGYPWYVSGNGPSVSIGAGSESFTCSYSHGTGGRGLCYSNQKIDFTDVKTVKIIYTGYSGGGGNRGLRATVFSSASSGSDSGSVASTGLGTPSSKSTATINTSGVTGSYYLGFYADSNSSGYYWNSSLTIYSIELIS